MEKQLVRHITHFLLELGAGFAFVGEQYHLETAGKDYYLDLWIAHKSNIKNLREISQDLF